MNQLKKDIESGRVKELMLIKTDFDVIKSNRDAMIYKVPRKIVSHNKYTFSLETERCKYGKPLDEYCLCEAYYTAFNYYDGKILKSEVSTYKVI